MKLLITTRADDGIKEISDITHPIIKDYAKRVGADFMILDHVPESDSGDGRPHYRIMKHYELHNEYDRILHLDTDMILTPDCPDLFKMVPYNKIGTVLEDKGTRKQHRVNLILSAQQKFGFVDWRSGYINTGVILTSKCHKEIFQKINGEFWTSFGSDDVQLGYLIKKHNFEIMDLLYQFNHMTMFSEPWNNSADRFESHIIHYAGSGVFDSRVSNKVEQMKLDYKRIYNSRTKILFVGVFDTNKKSTNTSQLIALKREGYNVIGYNYRKKAAEIGPSNRDKDLVSVIGSGSYDLVVYSKCNNVSEDVFVESRKYSKTCLWFMDPLATYDEEMRRKTSLVDYFCCDKENVLSSAKEINPFSYHIHEGFDEDVDRPHDLEKEYDLSFIGSVYGQRSDQLKQIAQDVKIINNAYGADHAKEVSKTRINLNFCTDEGASDRVYKVLAARGFLISDDWHNRDKYLTNGEDCVIFKDVGDLNNKIKYYLQNPELMEDIANNGFEKVQQFNRINWAKRIVELSSEC